MQKCFDKIIAPLDIINQIGNESEMELVHELNIDYVKKLENGLIYFIRMQTDEIIVTPERSNKCIE